MLLSLMRQYLFALLGVVEAFDKLNRLTYDSFGWRNACSLNLRNCRQRLMRFSVLTTGNCQTMLQILIAWGL